MPGSRDPRDLDGVVLMDFLIWNTFALEDEIHEAMKECGWKPWTTSNHINRDLFMKEMVDAWHFFMNILLAISPGRSSQEIAQEFAQKYFEKAKINEDRQKAGYDGIEGKCRNCGKDLATLGVSLRSEVHQADFCDRTCLGEYARKVRQSDKG